MSDATTIPIISDGDTGYGKFNNIRRLVLKLGQGHIAAVCIDAKLFPKNNSFTNRGAQPLAPIEEFCGKIKASKDTQTDPDFCIVAWIEAFIAGWGLEEALRWTEAYYGAVADGLLIRSKRPDPEDILAFMVAWYRLYPIILVPTVYYNTPTEVYENSGVSLVAWANNLLRSSIASMTQTVGQIYRDRCLMDVENTIDPVRKIFHFQRAEELQEA